MGSVGWRREKWRWPSQLLLSTIACSWFIVAPQPRGKVGLAILATSIFYCVLMVHMYMIPPNHGVKLGWPSRLPRQSMDGHYQLLWVQTPAGIKDGKHNEMFLQFSSLHYTHSFVWAIYTSKISTHPTRKISPGTEETKRGHINHPPPRQATKTKWKRRQEEASPQGA